ncbi:chaplin [Streptomyces sp. NPDC002088]|uniref:chaplin n=1 Tax=Streptomyces sp. NPDC002088 TaxID=3154665 RepID=UPI0033231D6C
MTTLRQTLSRGVFAAAAATGILSLSCGSALADTHAAGATKDSPGVLSGNTVQVPVHVPVNLCGNTVNGIAALNSAFGNSCSNTSDKTEGYGDSDYGTVDDTPASSGGSRTPSPTDDCETPAPTSSPTPPPTRSETPRPTPPPTRSSQTPPPADEEQPPQLAETGSKTLLATSAASAALIMGGVMMYRRGRTASQR